MWAIFRLNLTYYINNIDEAIYLSSFFIVVNVISYFSFVDKYTDLPQLFSLSTMLGLFIVCIQSSTAIYQRDADTGVLELYFQLRLSKYLIVIAKLLANYCAVMVALGLSLPVIFLIANQPLHQLAHVGVGLGAGGFAILILAHLASAITVGITRGRAMLLLLVFPLMLPILIFGSVYLQHPEAFWQPSLSFMLAYSIFMLPILCLTGAATMRNA